MSEEQKLENMARDELYTKAALVICGICFIVGTIGYVIADIYQTKVAARQSEQTASVSLESPITTTK